MSEMNEIPSTYQIRQEFVDLVTRDLLGPAEGPEEIVTDEQVFDRSLYSRFDCTERITCNPARGRSQQRK